MKKLIIILSVVYSYTLFAQENDLIQKINLRPNAPHLSSYLTPYYSFDTCGYPIDSIYFYAGNHGDYIAHYVPCGFISQTLAVPFYASNYEQTYSFTENDTVMIPHGFAQVIHNDSLIDIGGVSLLVDARDWIGPYANNQMITNVGDTILIIDELTMNVLYEQVLNDSIERDTTNIANVGFYEIIFDSAIHIQGNFLIAYKYHPNNISVTHQQTNVSPMYASYAMPPQYLHIISFPGLGRIGIFDLNQSTDQVYYYREDIGWQKCTAYRNYFSIPNHIAMTPIALCNIEMAQYTNLFPEDRTIISHTTDLMYFAIPEWAINRQTDTSGFSSITSIDNENAISITPNPTNDIVNVYCDYMMYFAEIYDLQGTKLDAKEINTYQTSLSLANYPDGIYLMKINTDKGFITKRIIKQ